MIETEEPALPDDRQPPLNHEPVWHFMLLYVASLGLYSLPWSYRNWKFVRDYYRWDISPFWRAVFTPVFMFSLAAKLLSIAREHGYRRMYPPILLGIGFVALQCTWQLPEPWDMLPVFAFLPLIPMVQAVNHYWQQQGVPPRTWFTGLEKCLLALGTVVWLMIAVNPFISETEMPPEQEEGTDTPVKIDDVFAPAASTVRPPQDGSMT